MSGKNTPYFELRDALLAGGCPLCRLRERAALRYIESVLYEGMTDPAVRNRLRAAQGLCRPHAWQMTRMRTSVLGTAIIYRDVLSDLIAGLDEQSGSGGWRMRARSSPALPKPQLPCPACEVGDDEAGRAGAVLRAHLGEAEIETAYQTAGGLCLPHLQRELGRASAREAETLRRWQRTLFEDLRAQLDELIRKHDYRFRQEPVGVEADAWLRAVARVVGEPDPEPPHD